MYLRSVIRPLAQTALRASLAAGFAFPSLAFGNGFPDFDPTREIVVLGSIAGVAADTDGPPGDPIKRGRWTNDDKGLSLVQAYWYGDNWWFPGHPGGVVDDGIVRARIDPGARLDLALMVRAEVDPSDLDVVQGYGLSLNRDKIGIYRWTEGRALPINPEVHIEGLASRDHLEVVVQLAGPFVTGMVFDGDTFELLGTTTAWDPKFASGQVGIRAFKKQDAATRVTAISVMDRTSAQSTSEPYAWYGNSRKVLIRQSDLAKLPADLQSAAEEPVIDDVPGVDEPQVVLTLDTVQTERLERLTDIEVLDIDPSFPWYVLDLEYRKRRDRSPRKDSSGGYVLTDSYKDANMVHRLLKAWAKDYPGHTKLVKLTESHQGNGVWALKISDNPGVEEDEPAMLLNGAHHGSELLSTEYTLDAIKMLVEQYGKSSRVTRWVDELEIWAVPVVNPDGNLLFMTKTRTGGRKNGRDTNGNGIWDPWDGVDLNRNYPFRWASLGEKGSRSWHRSGYYRGEEPASEPEVQAMMRLADEQHFAGAMTYHTNSTVLIAPYSIDHVDNPKPDVAWSVAEEVVASLPLQPNRRRFKVVSKIYSVDGVDQDWHYFNHGTMALLLEGSHHNPDRRSTRLKSIEATRPAFQTLFDRFLDGPSISGHVHDKKGTPVEAMVSIDEITTNEGEIWTSRPRDGRFDRYVGTPGTYTVTARASGWQPVSKTVKVNGHETVEIVLKKRAKGSGGVGND